MEVQLEVIERHNRGNGEVHIRLSGLVLSAGGATNKGEVGVRDGCCAACGRGC